MKNDYAPSSPTFRNRYYSEMNYEEYQKIVAQCPPAPIIRPLQDPQLQHLKSFKLQESTEEGENSEKSSCFRGDPFDVEGMRELEDFQKYSIQNCPSPKLKITIKLKSEGKELEDEEKPVVEGKNQKDKQQKEDEREELGDKEIPKRRRFQSQTNDYLILDILKGAHRNRKMVKRS